MHGKRVVLEIVGVAVAVGAAACSDSGGGAGVGLAFSTRPAPTSVMASYVGTGRDMHASVVQAGDSTVVALGNDTVFIRSVELVLREIELKRVDAIMDCDSTAAGQDDACEEFTVGVQLVALPLGNATDKVISIDAPAGLYDEIDFEIHKPESSDDAAFIAAHPDFDGVSIRVTGTYSQAGSRSDFVYTTDLDQEQEQALIPPLDVTAGGPVNVTLRVDVSSWFLTESGLSLVDPATANTGGPNEGVVKNNIEQSIAAFHDDDSDGLDDDSEDPDGGSGSHGI